LKEGSLPAAARPARRAAPPNSATRATAARTRPGAVLVGRAALVETGFWLWRLK